MKYGLRKTMLRKGSLKLLLSMMLDGLSWGLQQMNTTPSMDMHLIHCSDATVLFSGVMNMKYKKAYRCP